jgi:O-antigen/teichoic acid export membrane protein
MRGAVRGSTALAVGAAVSGVLAYVFFALVTRALGAEGAAPVSVLWTYWSFAAAFLTFPLQHWIVRSITARGSEGGVRAVRRQLAVTVLAVSVVAGVVAWLLRERLFFRDDVFFPLLVVAVTLGSAVMGAVRGVLNARKRLVAVAWALVLENAVRCAAAVGLILLSFEAAVAWGCALAAGQLVAFLWPGALRLAGDGSDRADEAWRGFLAGAAGGQLSAQLVLTGGPVALALLGGSPADVTALFAALALFRAPYTLAIGVMGPVTGRLTSLVVRRDHVALRRVRRLTVGGTVTTTALAALLGALVGPWLVELVFGSSVRVSALVATLTAAGCALALGNLVLMVIVLARDRAPALPRCWALAAVAGGVVLGATLLVGTPLVATCAAFAGAEATACAALLAVEVRAARWLVSTGPAVAGS